MHTTFDSNMAATFNQPLSLPQPQQCLAQS